MMDLGVLLLCLQLLSCTGALIFMSERIVLNLARRRAALWSLLYVLRQLLPGRRPANHQVNSLSPRRPSIVREAHVWRIILPVWGHICHVRQERGLIVHTCEINGVNMTHANTRNVAAARRFTWTEAESKQLKVISFNLRQIVLFQTFQTPFLQVLQLGRLPIVETMMPPW